MANRTTTSEVTHAVNRFYDKALLSRAIPSFVHTRFAQVRDIPRNSTNVINFRKYASFSPATTALVEGVTPEGSQLSVSDIQATVAQYGDFVVLTDWLQMTTLDPLLTETAEVLGEQAGDTLDQLCRDIMAAGNTVQYVSTSGNRAGVAAGMVLDGDEVREAVRTLEGNNTKKIKSQIDPNTGFNTSPVATAFIGIISEKTEFDLKGDPDWVPVDEYSSSKGVMEDEVGKLDKVRFISATSNAKTFSSTVTVHATLIFGREAYGISRISGEALKTITKQLGSSGTSDPLDQRSTMGWKASFVARILQQNFILRIEHAVSS